MGEYGQDKVNTDKIGVNIDRNRGEYGQDRVNIDKIG